MARTPTGIGKTYKIPGIVKLLFETPSGFAIFSFDEGYLKKDIEHIWIYFVGNYWHKTIVRLHEFRKFEVKRNVINITARTIDAQLTHMLWTYCNSDETLVVGSLAYKDLIEKLLGLNCHYEETVKEVMWGLQNLMRTLVPQEQSVITKDDLLPVSLGLNLVLARYKINVEKEMLNECIIEKTSKVYCADLHETAHSMFLHKRLDEKFMELSKLNTKAWSLFKLATALKIMFDPQGRLKLSYPHKIFSGDELTVIRRDAPLYQHTVNKDLILAVYDDVVTLRDGKADLLYELRILVKEAKAALETEQELSTNGVDSKKQVDSTCLIVDLTVPSQISIDEGQHCSITDAVGEEIMPPSNSAVSVLLDTSPNHSIREGDVHTSSIFSVAPQVVPRSTVPASQEINGLSTGVEGKMQEKQTENTSVRQANATLDECDVETRTIGGRDEDQETITVGRKQTESIGIVYSPKEKEKFGNSCEEKTNVILDGVGNDRTAVETAITEEKQQRGNASVKQNGTLNADSVEGNRTENTSTLDAVQRGNKVEGQKHAQESNAEWNTLQLTSNGEGRKQTECIVGLEGDEQKEYIGEDILPPGNTADSVLFDSPNHNMREGDVRTSSIFSVAPQVVPRSTVPASQEINALSTGVEGKMQEKETENTSFRQANAIPDEYNVETHTIGGNDQDQETIADGIKQTASVESADNPNGTELSGNSCDKTKLILDGVGNGLAAVETATTEEKQQCGNASVKQNGNLNADNVEENRTEDTSTQDAVQHGNNFEGQKHAQESNAEWNTLQLTNNGEGRKQNECIVGLEGDEQKEDIGEDILPPRNNADSVLFDTSPNHSMREDDVHTSSIFSVAPQVVPKSMVPASQEINALSTGVERKMQEKETENTSVRQGNAIPGEYNVETHTIGGNDQHQETTIAEGIKQMAGVESVDNPKGMELSGNSCEEKTNVILDGVGNDLTAVETATTEEKQQRVNASVKQNGTLNADSVEGNWTEDTSTQDAVQHENNAQGQKHAQESNAEWNTLQLTSNGEERKQTECNVGLKGDEQKDDIGEDNLPPSSSAGPVLLDTLPNHSLQEINELGACVKGKMQEMESGDASVKQAIAIPDEHAVETHTSEEKNQDQETIAEGRKQTEGIECR